MVLSSADGEIVKITRRMLHEDLQPGPVYRQQLLANWLFRHQWSTRLANCLLSGRLPGQVRDSVAVEEFHLPTSDGARLIRVKIYRPTASSGRLLPPMLYAHGGGYITGAPEPFAGAIARFIKRRPCVVIAPAYRTAFERPYPAALDDCYSALLWTRDQAADLGVDARRFILAGHSAGGGLTAALALRARDSRDVAVAFQMPFYPMIDDQQPLDPARLIDSPGWNTRNNALGWSSYLRDLHAAGADIPAYAAPARAIRYAGLPPTITFVGEYEPFYWETVEYVRRLQSAGIDVVFRTFAKCTHGPDMIVPGSSLGREAIAFSLDSYADFYDRYVLSDTHP